MIALLAGTVLALSWYHMLLRSTSFEEDFDPSEPSFDGAPGGYSAPHRRKREANEEIYTGRDGEGVDFNQDLEDHLQREQRGRAAEEEQEEEEPEDEEEDPVREGAESYHAHTGLPKAVLHDTPTKLSRDPKPVMRFGADRPGCTFKIKLDSSAWIDAKSPLRFRQSLSDGWHTFAVRAWDASGQSDPNPVELHWKVDATPPKTFIEKFPSDPSNVAGATFEVRSNERGCSFPYSIDVRAKGEVQWASMPLDTHVKVNALTVHKVRMELWNLTDGQYRFNVAARDEAGNSARPLVFVWMVDLQPPETVIHTGPRKLAKSTTAEFIVSAAGEEARAYVYQYRLDKGTWVPGKTDDFFGDGYRFVLRELKEGPRVIEVRTVDRAGNIDPSPARYEWTIHVKPADTFVVHRPREVTNNRNASFTIESSETQYTYAYKLDNGPVVRPVGHRLVTGEQHFSVAGLEDGPHQLAVRATDVTGAEDPSPAVVRWTVDLVPPTVQVVQRPPAVTLKKDAVFVVNCSEACTAQYSLNGGPWASIDKQERLHAGPLRFRVSDLYEGRHTLAVLAADQAGNHAEQASLEWVIDLGPPKTTIKAAPEKHSHTHKSVFHLVNTEADCQYEYRLDRGHWKSAHKAGGDAAWAAVPREREASGGTLSLQVPAGFHLIEIRAKDAAGTKETDPVSFEWVVY